MDNDSIPATRTNKKEINMESNTQIIEYAKAMNVDGDVIDWLNKHVIDKVEFSQSESEHVIDYLASNDRPKRISRMSYEQAKKKTDMWVKTLDKVIGKKHTILNDQQITESGDCLKIAASGYRMKIAASGYRQKIAGAGNFQKIEIIGEHSIGACLGRKSRIKAKNGTPIAIAEYYDDGIHKQFLTGIIGQDGLKEDVWYAVEDGKFKEVDHA